MDILRKLFGRALSPSKIAPVIESPTERGIDRDYRRPGDPEHIIRVNQKAPSGLPKKLKKYVPVAGISQPESRANAISFMMGESRKVKLKQQQDNPYDPNAAKVVGKWQDSGEIRTGKLGYLPAKVAKELIEHDENFRFGATVEAMFMPYENKDPGVRIAIWAPRARRKP